VPLDGLKAIFEALGACDELFGQELLQYLRQKGLSATHMAQLQSAFADGRRNPGACRMGAAIGSAGAVGALQDAVAGVATTSNYVSVPAIGATGDSMMQGRGDGFNSTGCPWPFAAAAFPPMGAPAYLQPAAPQFGAYFNTPYANCLPASLTPVVMPCGGIPVNYNDADPSMAAAAVAAAAVTAEMVWAHQMPLPGSLDMTPHAASAPLARERYGIVGAGAVRSTATLMPAARSTSGSLQEEGRGMRSGKSRLSGQRQMKENINFVQQRVNSDNRQRDRRQPAHRMKHPSLPGVA